MSTPMGWPANISQIATYGLPATMSWPATTSAAVVIEAYFGVPPMAVFPWPCDPARIEESVTFQTAITRFESGREQRRARGLPRRRWRLRFRKDEADANAIWDFYVAMNGPVDPFLWGNPVDRQAYWVRFPGPLTRRAIRRAVYEFGIELVEVRR